MAGRAGGGQDEEGCGGPAGGPQVRSPQFPRGKEPPVASLLQTLGPLSGDGLPAGGQGTPDHVPMEGASSPPGSLIQAAGSCAVALRQLFLAWRIPAQSRPHKPVPSAGRSSSRGAPPGPSWLCAPCPRLSLPRSMGCAEPPTERPRWAEVWLEGGLTRS